MPNLVDQLGARYIREFCAGAYVQKGNLVHKLEVADEASRQLVTRVIDLRHQNPRWNVSTDLAYDDLPDFTALKYPKLGYRMFRQGKIGPIVVHFSTTRAATRGLRYENLQQVQLPVFDVLSAASDEGYDSVNEARRVREIFQPTFLPFSVGLKQLLAGEIAGFAINEDLACGISVDQSAERAYDVYFRGRVIGSVDENGTLLVTNKVLQRESIKRKLFQ